MGSLARRSFVVDSLGALAGGETRMKSMQHFVERSVVVVYEFLDFVGQIESPVELIPGRE